MIRYMGRCYTKRLSHYHTFGQACFYVTKSYVCLALAVHSASIFFGTQPILEELQVINLRISLHCQFQVKNYEIVTFFFFAKIRYSLSYKNSFQVTTCSD